MISEPFWLASLCFSTTTAEMPLTKVRNATSGVSDIAKAIAIPQEHRPIRIPTYPSLERSAVLHLQQTRTLKVGAAGYFDAMLFRSPVHPLWGTYQPSTSNAAVYCSWNYTASTILTTTTSMPINAGVFGTPQGVGVGGPDWAAVTPVGYGKDGLPYMYIPANVLFQATLNSTATFTTWEMDLECYYGTDDSSERLSIMLTGSGVFGNGLSINANAWVRPVALRFTAAPTVAGNLTYVNIGFFGGGSFNAPNAPIIASFFPLFPVPEIQNSVTPYYSTRCTAAAVLFSNVTAVLQKEGTVQAGRLNVSSGYPYDPSFSFGVLTSLHPQEKYFGKLEDGLYAFSLPSAESDTFRDCVSLSAIASKPFPLFHIEGFGYYQHMRFSDLDATSATQLAITLDYHLEFRSSSMLFNLGYSSLPLEAYHEAQLALVKMGTFFENPKHISQITKKVLNSLPKVRAPALVVMKVTKGAGRPDGSKGGKKDNAPKQNGGKGKKSKKGKDKK